MGELFEFITLMVFSHLLAGCILAGFTGVLLRNKPFNAASRHNVWLGCLVIVLLMPLSAIFPQVSIENITTDSIDTTSIRSPSPSDFRAVSAKESYGLIQSVTAPHVNSVTTSPDTALGALTDQAEQLQTTPLSAKASLIRSSSYWIGLILIILLGTGSIIRFIGLVGAYLNLKKLIQQSTPVSTALQDMAETLAKGIGLQICPGMYHSREISSPFASGILRPRVLLSSQQCIGQTKPLVVQQIILHELAHIKRRDPCVAALQSFVSVMFFWHPAVIFINRRIHDERELACDDWVVQKDSCLVESNLKDYAKGLLVITGSLAIKPANPLTVSWVHSASALGSRVESLLNKNINHSTIQHRLPALGLYSGATLVLILSAPLWPNAPKIFASDQVVDGNSSINRAIAILEPAILLAEVPVVVEQVEPEIVESAIPSSNVNRILPPAIQSLGESESVVLAIAESINEPSAPITEITKPTAQNLGGAVDVQNQRPNPTLKSVDIIQPAGVVVPGGELEDQVAVSRRTESTSVQPIVKGETATLSSIQPQELAVITQQPNANIAISANDSVKNQAEQVDVGFSHGLAVDSSIGEIELIRQQIINDIRLQRWQSVTENFERIYLIQKQNTDISVSTFLNSLNDIRAWHLTAIYIDTPLNRIHHFLDSREILKQIIFLAERIYGETSEELIPWLYKFAVDQHYAFAFLGSRDRLGSQAAEYLDALGGNSSDRYLRNGVSIVERIQKIVQSMDDAEAQAMAMLYVADFEMLRRETSLSRFGSRQTTRTRGSADKLYRRARNLLEEAEIEGVKIESYLSRPVVLPVAEYYLSVDDAIEHQTDYGYTTNTSTTIDDSSGAGLHVGKFIAWNESLPFVRRPDVPNLLASFDIELHVVQLQFTINSIGKSRALRSGQSTQDYTRARRDAKDAIRAMQFRPAFKDGRWRQVRDVSMQYLYPPEI